MPVSSNCEPCWRTSIPLCRTASCWLGWWPTASGSTIPAVRKGAPRQPHRPPSAKSLRRRSAPRQTRTKPARWSPRRLPRPRRPATWQRQRNPVRRRLGNRVALAGLAPAARRASAAAIGTAPHRCLRGGRHAVAAAGRRRTGSPDDSRGDPTLRVAARCRRLHVRRPGDRAALRLPPSAPDRPHPTVRHGRRQLGGKPQAALRCA